MTARSPRLVPHLAIGLLAWAIADPSARAMAKEPAGGQKVAGILIDKQANSLSVKADGEDEPVQYRIDPADKVLAESLKGLFTVSRVALTYSTDGDARKLTSIKRQVGKATGSVTGEVVKNYGWWIEVKPAKGVADGYACNFPFDKHQDTMDQLKQLAPGDWVTISFATDFERHRIQTLRKTTAPAHKGAATTAGGAAGKERGTAAGHEAAKAAGKAAGLLIDRKDDWLTVKIDGDDEPTRFEIDKADKPLQESLKATFNACRVQLTYRTQDEKRQLTGIKRQILKQNGTITGEVVKVWNDFWVEVKPKNGLADGFAPGANWNDKAFMETLRGLKPGESVTITYMTDFERHRITSLKKNPGK